MPKRNSGFRLEWRAEREVWEIIWFEHGRRKRLSTRTQDRKKADQILARHIKISKDRAVSRLIGDVLADYYIERGPQVAAPERISACILKLAPFFGDMAVDDLTKAKCREYLESRHAQPGTVRKELGCLRAALNHDKTEGRIKEVPAVWLPDSAQAKDRWLTRKEAAALLRSARKVAHHLPWFILISLYTGQRKTAVLNLTWDRVNLERGIINWQYGRETKKRRIIQPMPDELRFFLKLLSKHGTEGHVVNYYGKPIKDIRKGFEVAAENAKLKDVTPHTLKHTAITWMLQNGTDLWSVAGFTGTSTKTLETVYGHHSPEYLEAARTSFKSARKRRLTAP